MDQPHSCGAYFLLGWFFPYCFSGGEQLWRASPLNHFCNWSRCSFDEATVMLLIPSQFCFGWSMVECLAHQWYKYKWQHHGFFCKWINLTAVGPIVYWGCFFLTVSWGVHSSAGPSLLKTILAIEIDAFLMKQLWCFWFQVISVLVGSWWSLGTSKVSVQVATSVVFLQMDQPHSCGAYFLLGWFFPYCFLGGEQLWRASPFENHFCNWNRCSFDEATVMLLIPSHFCFGWSMVKSGTSIV